MSEVFSMTNGGLEDDLLNWCSSETEDTCSASEIPGIRAFTLPQSLQYVKLHTEMKALIDFFHKFMKAKMGSHHLRRRDDLVSTLAYASGLCMTRQFVIELVKELLSEGRSSSGSLLRSELEPQQNKSNEPGTLSVPPVVTDIDITEGEVKHEVLEDVKVEEPAAESAAEDNLPNECTPKWKRRVSANHKHAYRISKNVPPKYAYCMRGASCKLCHSVFKGIACVEELVDHTIKVHKKVATARFLKKLRDDNTARKIIGHGMQWCDCSTCLFVAESHNWLG